MSQVISMASCPNSNVLQLDTCVERLVHCRSFRDKLARLMTATSRRETHCEVSGVYGIEIFRPRPGEYAGTKRWREHRSNVQVQVSVADRSIARPTHARIRRANNNCALCPQE